jgi:hypothetical protein
MQSLSRLDDLENCSDEETRAVIANDILEDVYRSKLSVEQVAKRLSSDSVGNKAGSGVDPRGKRQTLRFGGRGASCGNARQ